MAHASGKRLAVRSSYVNEQLDLKEAAARHKVSYATALRWKAKAASEGDNWDTSRNSLLLAQGGKKELINQVLERFFTQSENIFKSIDEAENLSPAAKVDLIAKWTDSVSKIQKLLGPSNDFNKIGFSLELLQKLGTFIREHYPQHAHAFIEILEPFGQVLSRDYG
ncbi:DUF1804 family protein [Bowmanella dokdonensis]|uniref:DUF1804 family protein n=1 Tax=Bowmanella dokdonensis TaxID=751969 RepID=A0A939DLB3_9ALTE|nr:DUF1804 family protein [Bowmanella dokdonensis]